jgi:hypothetical protein
MKRGMLVWGAFTGTAAEDQTCEPCCGAIAPAPIHFGKLYFQNPFPHTALPSTARITAFPRSTYWAVIGRAVIGRAALRTGRRPSPSTAVDSSLSLLSRGSLRQATTPGATPGGVPFQGFAGGGGGGGGGGGWGGQQQRGLWLRRTYCSAASPQRRDKEEGEEKDSVSAAAAAGGAQREPHKASSAVKAKRLKKEKRLKKDVASASAEEPSMAQAAMTTVAAVPAYLGNAAWVTVSDPRRAWANTAEGWGHFKDEMKVRGDGDGGGGCP